LEASDRGKLIDHISKEIEAQTNNMMAFRTRAILPVFLGPFILLSSVVITAKGIPLAITFDRLTVGAFIGLAVSYLVLGLSAAGIEWQMWEQCNTWRDLIVKLVCDSGTTEAEVRRALTFKPKLFRGYLAMYSAMFLAFVCAIIIVLQVK
jgi:hypothetical protein